MKERQPQRVTKAALTTRAAQITATSPRIHHHECSHRCAIGRTASATNGPRCAAFDRLERLLVRTALLAGRRDELGFVLAATVFRLTHAFENNNQ
jgi:hypothetical protein